MVGYTKSNFEPSGKNFRVRFSRFSLGKGKQAEKQSGVLYGSESKNCDLSDGRLTCGVGASAFTNAQGAELEIPEASSLTVFSYRSGLYNYKYRLGYTDGAGGVFLYNTSSGAFEDILGGTSEAFVFEAMSGSKEGILMLYNASGAWTYARSGTLTQQLTRNILAGCFYGERAFFAAHPFTVLYSSSLDPSVFTEDVEEAGKIEFPSDKGKIHSFAELNGKLYAFRENGVLQITAKGSALDFEANEIELAIGGIFKGSVGACGKYIFFLTAEGLFAFDGTGVEKILTELEIFPLAEGQACTNACVRGKYYLQYLDRSGSKKAIVVDGTGKSGYYTFYKKALSDCDGRGLFLKDSAVYAIDENAALPQGESYYFKAETEFGVTGEKTLKTLRLKGEGLLKAVLSSERATREFEVDLTGGDAVLKIGLKGKAFSLEFHLQKGSAVKEAEAELYALTK
ncbi:MAG: hypothetical protein IJ506_08210 [Clostridia bacterium]|nr:hypothetical protein [Clostridia bacterium]